MKALLGEIKRAVDSATAYVQTALASVADLVVFLHREDPGGEKKPQSGTFQIELIIGKQRNGPIGTVNLVYISEITRFENYVSDTRVADVGPTI